MQRLALAIALVVLSVCACGTPGAVYVSGVAVVMSPSMDKLPFDPRGARLAAATQQLSVIAGHPVTFQIDAALVPEWRSSFEEALIDSIESVARDLAELKEHEPEVYAHGAPLLERIECHYDALAEDERPATDLDPRTHAIVIKGPLRRWSALVPHGLVLESLRAEYQGHVDRTFTTKAPDQVAAGERRAYFHYLTGYRRGQDERKGDDKLTPLEKLSGDPRAERILKVVRLSEVVGRSDEALAKDIRTWLLEQRDYFHEAYSRSAPLVRAAPASSTWHRAETAWVKWLTSQLPTMSKDERLDFARSLFIRSAQNDGETSAYVSIAFPGIDPFAFGLGVAGEWAAAGHPTQLTPDRQGWSPLYDFIICPHPKNPDGKRTLGPHCEYDWYQYALDSKENTRRLVDAVIAKKDPVFTEMVVIAIRYAHTKKDSVEGAFEFWAALGASPVAWQAAGHTLADYFGDTSVGKDRVVDEARRHWKAHPERRGVLLYFLGQVQYFRGDSYLSISKERFAEAFGMNVSAADFASYLENGPRAVILAPAIWPSLGDGFSRAGPILAHMDALFADPQERGYDNRAVDSAVSGIVDRLCEDHNEPDLALMHAYFARHIAAHPGDSVRDVMDRTEPGKCAAKVHHVAPPSTRPSSTPRIGPPLPPKSLSKPHPRGSLGF